MKKLIFTGLFLLASQANAALISATDYDLTSIVGSYAWGQTNWNDAVDSGYVNNVSDLAMVEALMSDGYVDSPAGSGPINGIYNWDSVGFHALTFEFIGGADYILDSLSFISSRSYGAGTPIGIDYQLDGGAWINALSTTSGALGITTDLYGSTYTIDFGGVQADAFRFTTTGGSQVSLHEISVAGASLVPEPASLALLGLGLAGLGFSRRNKTA